MQLTSTLMCHMLGAKMCIFCTTNLYLNGVFYNLIGTFWLTISIQKLLRGFIGRINEK